MPQQARSTPRARLSEAEPARKAAFGLDTLTDAINQVGITIFVPFVPFAAIAAVLALTTDVDVVGKLEKLADLARGRSAELERVHKLIGANGPDAFERLEDIQAFKSGYEEMLVAQVTVDNTSYDLAATEVGHMGHEQRVEQLVKQVVGRVSATAHAAVASASGREKRPKPFQLEPKTLTTVESRALELEPQVTLALWTRLLREVEERHVLDQSMWSTDRRSDAETARIAREAIQSYLQAELAWFASPPEAEVAQAALSAESERRLADEARRLDEEDEQLGRTLASLASKVPLELAVCLDEALGTTAVADELCKAAPSLPADRAAWGVRTRETFDRLVRERLQVERERHDERLATTVAQLDAEKLPVLSAELRGQHGFADLTRKRIESEAGLAALGATWAPRLPRTADAVRARSAAHVQFQTQALKGAIGSKIAGISDAALDQLPRATLEDAVVRVANALPERAGAAPSPETRSLSAEVSAAAGLDPQLLDAEERARLDEQVGKLLDTRARTRLTDLEQRVAAVGATATSKRVRAADRGRREELLTAVRAEVLAEVEAGGFTGVSAYASAGAFAQARAAKLIDAALDDSRGQFARYASAALGERAAQLGAVDVRAPKLDATATALVASLFPPPAGEDPSLQGMQLADLAPQQRKEIENEARTLVAARQAALIDAAQKTIKATSSEQLAGIRDLADLSKALDVAAAKAARETAQGALRESLADAWLLPGVEDAAKKHVEKLYADRVASLRNSALIPALLACELPTTRFHTAVELAAFERHVPAASELLAKAALAKVGMASKSAKDIPSFLNGPATEHARKLLEARRASLAKEQLERAEALLESVDLQATTGETEASYLDRDVKQIAEKLLTVAVTPTAKARAQPVLDEVVAEIRKRRQPKAAEKIRSIVAQQQQLDEALAAFLGRSGLNVDEIKPTERKQIEKTLQRTLGPEFVLKEHLTADEIGRMLVLFDAAQRNRADETAVAKAAQHVSLPATLFQWARVSEVELLRKARPLEDKSSLYKGVRDYESVVKAILKQAGFVEGQASRAAVAQAEREAVEICIARSEETLAKEAQRSADDAAAEKLRAGVAGPLVAELETRFRDANSDALNWEEGRIAAEVAKLEQLATLTPGVRSSLERQVVSDIVSRQHRIKSEVKAELGSRINKLQKEDAAEIEKAIEDYARRHPGARLPDSVINAIQDALATKLGLTSARVALMRDELNDRSQFLAGSILSAVAPSTQPATSAQKPPGAGTGAVAGGGGASGSGTGGSASPARGGNSTTSPGSTSSTSTPPGPTQPGTTPPGRIPAPPVPPSELVVTVRPLDPKTSDLEISIQEYFRTPQAGAAPAVSYGKNCVQSFTVRLGEMTEERYAQVSADIGAWLDGDEGLSKAVDFIRNTYASSRNTHLKIHLRTAGDRIPQGLGLLLQKVTANVIAAFPAHPTFTVKWGTWSMWDDTATQRKSVVDGNESEAPAPVK